MIPQQTIDRVIETIAERYRPQKIILFGSYASGNPGRASDLDLFVIKETAYLTQGSSEKRRVLWRP